eukprot:TRINITY_DN62459_c0_g1_i1.p1 TRINITY_DN62459_c0_g1~~TRINITY_DN62459_c0_g1_i1.p1  ORF type:complete len:116 (+),score=18.12 TRINITY_DN62459_c0_g1_i1:211-558(+)
MLYFQEKKATFLVRKPPCDKLNLNREPSMKACKNFKDVTYAKWNNDGKQGKQCLKAAVKTMKAKLQGDSGQQPLCKVTFGSTTCEYPGRSLSPACCTEMQKKKCYTFKKKKPLFL